MRTLLFIIFFFSSFSVSAATLYVRAGANGNGSGVDWNNAYPSLPGQLVRGNTYYVADGSYPAYTFDDVASGSQVISVKKATAAEHGAASDWQSSYGDGQAVFTSWTFRTGYYNISGQVRNNSNWQADSSYGFDVNGEITISDSGVDGLTLDYFSVGGAVGAVYPNIPTFGIKATAGSTKNLYVGHCFVHNAEILIHSRNNSNTTIEYCQIGPGFGKEAISHQSGSSWTIRYNKFIDACVYPANEGCTAVIGMFNFTGGGDPSGCACDNMLIYGNVFAETGSYSAAKADALIILNATNNSRFYNNSIVRNQGAWAGAIRLINGTGNEIKNNLWYWVGDYDSAWGGIVAAEANAVSNNWCYYKNTKPARLGANCGAIGGTRFSGSEDPFVDISTGDYRLKSTFVGVSPRNAGLNLGTAFSIDMNGRVRGADGGWDIGAFEYADGGAVAPMPAPTGLRITN